MENRSPLHSSFRDPGGYMFTRGGVLYRQINNGCHEDYELLMGSGLYAELVSKGLLIPHEEENDPGARSEGGYKVIRPERIAFISYPYEWCFSQLKDAALLTLQIQNIALSHGMTLKDCSAYNVQFHKGRPVFIDTLSFEKYAEGQPWTAYRQFCQHFLAPLALMCLADRRLNQLMETFIDGVPLDLASRLLPFTSRLNMPLLLHIHLHAKSQAYYSGQKVSANTTAVSMNAQLGLIDNLRSGIEKLAWRDPATEWGAYYDRTSYSPEGFEHKKRVVAELIAGAKPGSVWDMGSNDGTFSHIAAERGIPTVAFDGDITCVEKNYRRCVDTREANLLPLLLDMTNPSPAIGWHSRERMSFFERGRADMVMALAVIHHLALSSNVPLARLAEFFAVIGDRLVVEFVPKSDPQVGRLFTVRRDIFPEYTREGFEEAFRKWFTVEKSIALKDSERVLYSMVRN